MGKWCKTPNPLAPATGRRPAFPNGSLHWNCGVSQKVLLVADVIPRAKHAARVENNDGDGVIS